MTTAELAARLIQNFEGCKLVAYFDPPALVWTIGFGHTRTAKPGMVITQAQADALLAEDCAPLLKLVEGRPMIEAAALVSFGFNCGGSALRRLLAGEIDFTYGRTARGVTVPGLVQRRALEHALVLASRDSHQESPIRT